MIATGQLLAIGLAAALILGVILLYLAQKLKNKYARLALRLVGVLFILSPLLLRFIPFSVL